ncbi:MAG: transcription elongation factor GreA [Spirochaetaceae bacterium]|nr:transcription elongation factor GreA [Spirochaetaceae bacterium]
MTESLLNRIEEMLNEEKWTRAALTGYTTSNFHELDELLREAKEQDVQNAVQELCEDHLQVSRDSIIALYLAGTLTLGRRIVDDSNLVVLTNMFVDSAKWNIVQYLCTGILAHGENKFALRTLADTYDKTGDKEQQYEIWERLIKVDFEDADTARALAEKSEEESDLDSALSYYKKALHRYINRRQHSPIKQVWGKIIELQPDDLEGLMQIEARVARALGGDRAVALLEVLYPHFREDENWDASVAILKRILYHDPKNNGARAELVDVYSNRYAGHSHLDDYIKISNLSQSWRNVHEAIADFEKHISFDEGHYVFHRTWGLGRIKSIKDDQFVIDFLKKRGHKMSLKMAVSALHILANDHFWVIRATVPRDKIKDRVKADPVWALRTIIKSFNNAADMKRIKAELVPRILTPSEWTKWSTTARRILKTDSIFGSPPGKLDLYSVRDRPISFEEKTFNKFRSAKTFLSRVQTLHEFLDLAQPDSEYLGDMYQYFAGFLKASSGQIENSIASLLIVERLNRDYPYLDPNMRVAFADQFADIDDLEFVFAALDSAGLARDFLTHVRNDIGAWPHVYARIFLFHPLRQIVDTLVSPEHADVVSRLVSDIVDDYRDYRLPFVWLVRNEGDTGWLAKHDVRQEKVLIGMIHLLDLTYRDIGNKRDPQVNRKLNRQIADYLFKEHHLDDFIATAGEESITRIYTLVEDVKDLDPSIKLRLRQQIKERFPSYRFADEAEKETVRLGLLVTRAGYEGRQRELREILEVEIPENSKEIGLALQKGDLRENAEYKAALEKQEQLKNSVSRLQEDLQNAQIFDLDEANDAMISFGTRVKLTNIESNATEQYLILGPWESDPNRNIISYLSPLGAELWNHRANDELEFTINNKDFRYRIDRIDKIAQLDAVGAGS